jgi:PAS domain S-box-containing protein
MNREDADSGYVIPAQSLLDGAERLARDEAMARARIMLGGETKFWETVVEMLSDAVFLVGPDKRILYWNRAAERLTGYPRDQVIGSHCLRAVHCNVCEHRCGVFEFGNLENIPLVLKSRDGSRIEVLKSATVVHDDAGKPLLGIEVLRDVTEWNAKERVANEARDAAERQRALLQNVLDSVTEGIVGLSADDAIRFVSTSAEGALGVVEAETLGRHISEVAGDEIARIAQHVRASKTPVSRARIEVSGVGAQSVPLAVTVSPLELPDDPDGVMVLVRDLREEERKLRERMRVQGFAYGTLVSRSPRMREVFDLIDQVAPTGATILVQGESGTGKELVAREIHKRSRRASGPFHAVNCAAIASEILESEFFGHERGAFTGAVALKRGRFEVAHSGTIFLDEVGELPLELQGKLLRVLEERTFERVGGTKPIQVDVRVIAATNRSLREMVARGQFREDLYYRLRVVPLRLPPLRERMEDVEPLAEHILMRLAEREGRDKIRLGSDALRLMLDYPWPGNVRELANAMEYVSVVSKGPVAHAEDLPREVRSRSRTARLAVPSDPVATPALEANPPAVQPSSAQPTLSAEALLGDEKMRIEAALLSTRYSHGDAAKMLGMHRTTLYRKRLRYGI